MAVNFAQSIKANDIIKAILALIVLYAVYTFYIKREEIENIPSDDPPKDEKKEPQSSDQNSDIDADEKLVDKMLGGSTSLTADDLLPKYDDAAEFAEQNPVDQLLKEQNFVISGHHMGINTVMQSNKIAYHDLRSLPPIPKEVVGPWNQSSYEQSPAQMRRFLEIGS